LVFVYREFLTGFHKRKLEKKEASKKRAIEREKQERLEARREVCLPLFYCGCVYLGLWNRGCTGNFVATTYDG
jgi:hypothetical protein